MKLQIERRDLLELATKAANVVQSKNTIPILGNVLLEASLTLKATATDLDRQIETQAQADVTKEGKTTVDAKMLAGIAGKLPDGAMVTLEDDGQYLHVKAGRQKYKLAALDADDFPVMKQDDFNTSFDIDGQKLKTVLEKTVWAASSEETRYYLQGVALQTYHGRSVAISTDGHRLARFFFDAGDDLPNVIVPAKTVQEFVRIIKEGDVTISLNDNKIRLEYGDTSITSKLIDGTYPDWTRVIPKENVNSITANSVDLKLAIDAVLPVADDRTRAVKLTVADSHLGIAVRAQNGGLAEDAIDVVQDGVDIEIGLNSKYALDALKQSDKGDVTIRYNGPGDPVAIDFASEPDLLGVLMPMRI